MQTPLASTQGRTNLSCYNSLHSSERTFNWILEYGIGKFVLIKPQEPLTSSRRFLLGLRPGPCPGHSGSWQTMSLQASTCDEKVSSAIIKTMVDGLYTERHRCSQTLTIKTSWASVPCATTNRSVNNLSGNPVRLMKNTCFETNIFGLAN